MSLNTKEEAGQSRLKEKQSYNMSLSTRAQQKQCKVEEHGAKY